MIEIDKKQLQILSKACFNCSDSYFQPGHSSLPVIGCCSYSPVISLYEINQMVQQTDRNFFINTIYKNDNCTINDFNIIIHAHVHPLFEEENTDQLSSIELSDLKLSYSTCQFFERNKGCSLKPSYKNATCRSFICSTIEDQLDTEHQKHLSEWSRTIQLETKTFNDIHQAILKEKGLSLTKNVDTVLDYLENL
ncbi:hypothetical protein [Alkalihalobacterium chitinilyticum]|uniref:YkgJ family cysteine cluster protein n=1 Tax=Alkalihalobacterium chitinilyticum TaxID=2980103 RepID=A0ABT5V8Q6_9BACI|nr:hypothetical protein [Alkalihalobacterium chitinilyticum]MDE5411831.1 hypothetical protein [Alkalihalobacterium chitinilyticum]